MSTITTKPSSRVHLGATGASWGEMSSPRRIHGHLGSTFPTPIDKAVDREIERRLGSKRGSESKLVYGIAIDPIDASERDDAINLVKNPKGDGYILQVHVPDLACIAHLIELGSEYDFLSRGQFFSVYGDSFCPMLHPDIYKRFSLNQGRQTPVKTVSIYLDEYFNRTGEVSIENNVLRPVNIAYEEYSQLHNDDQFRLRVWRKRVQLLEMAVQKSPFKSFDESEIGFSGYRHTSGYKLVAACMVEANSAVDRFIHEKGGQTFTRRCTSNNRFAHMFSSDLSRSENLFIDRRNIPIASYGLVRWGHEVLGKEHYTHFTSPLRRSPDFIVGLIVENLLSGKPLPNFIRDRDFNRLAQDISLCEYRLNRDYASGRGLFQYFKDERSEVFSLSREEFSFLLQSALGEVTLGKAFRERVIRGIKNQSLPPDDVVNILFLSLRGSEEWADLRKGIIRYLVNEGNHEYIKKITTQANQRFKLNIEQIEMKSGNGNCVLMSGSLIVRCVGKNRDEAQRLAMLKLTSLAAGIDLKLGQERIIESSSELIDNRNYMNELKQVANSRFQKIFKSPVIKYNVRVTENLKFVATCRLNIPIEGEPMVLIKLDGQEMPNPDLARQSAAKAMLEGISEEDTI